jgi:Tetratricopeptide repeat
LHGLLLRILQVSGRLSPHTFPPLPVTRPRPAPRDFGDGQRWKITTSTRKILAADVRGGPALPTALARPDIQGPRRPARGPPRRVPARPGPPTQQPVAPAGDLGRSEYALAAIQEAVTIRRGLAAARPAAFRPDLASSLNNLSGRLGDLGRREDALAAIQEAVDIRRELAARWPDGYQQELEKSFEVVTWLERHADLGNASRQEAKE